MLIRSVKTTWTEKMLGKEIELFHYLSLFPHSNYIQITHCIYIYILKMAGGMKIMSSFPAERSRVMSDKKAEKVVIKPVQVKN